MSNLLTKQKKKHYIVVWGIKFLMYYYYYYNTEYKIQALVVIFLRNKLYSKWNEWERLMSFHIRTPNYSLE